MRQKRSVSSAAADTTVVPSGLLAMCSTRACRAGRGQGVSLALQIFGRSAGTPHFPGAGRGCRAGARRRSTWCPVSSVTFCTRPAPK